jgi:hypothetical protein
VTTPGERDLEVLLRGLRPRLQDGEWVFVAAPRPPEGVTPLASFLEDEGLSLVVRREQADAAGLPYTFVAAWISLTVHSALDAVGLTAAVAGQLAEAGISCNVVAARRHDHLFVPHGRARQALVLLEQLSRGITIQPLPEHLYDDAVALWQLTGLVRPWNDPAADLDRAITGSASTVLAAVAQDGLLATAMVGHDGHRGWVYYLAVTPAEQGHGLGRRLMQACEEWVRARGLPKLQLMVRADNAAVVAFYERLGYTDGRVVVLGRRLDGDVP